jgi:Holliday junction resolvasome RuvABC endonuclease subunit
VSTKTKTEWAPPTLASFRLGSVIAFDQAVAKTGIVALAMRQIGLQVVEAALIRTPEVTQGHEDTLQRAMLMCDRYVAFLRRYDPEEWGVVNELPPHGRQVAMRPESSWLAALALRHAVARTGHHLMPMVGATTHKKQTSGNHAAKKAAHHEVLMKWAGPMVMDSSRVTNQDLRDAFSIALTTLMRDR